MIFDWLRPRVGVDAANNVGNFIFGDVTGNVTQLFYQGAPPEPPTLPWRGLPDDADVFRLLSWRTRLTPLVGRDGELGALLDWARSGSGVKVRFLTGAGGAGKSRLAAEAAQRLKDDGWSAGFAAFDQPRIIPVTAAGLMLVLDYVEEKRPQAVDLLAHLARQEQAPSRVRIVFLSRRDPEWWQEDIDAAHAADICEHQPVALEAVDDVETVALVNAVQARVSQHLHLSPMPVDAAAVREWRGRDPELHALPLFVQAAAIHAVLEQRPIGLDGPEVMRALVRRERLRIDNIGRARGFGAHGAARLVGLAAAPGALDRQTIRRLADPQLELGVPPPEQIVDAVAALPQWDGDHLPALTPGVLASGFLLEILNDRPDLAPEWLWTVVGDAGPEWIQRIERDAYDATVLHGAGGQRMSAWLTQMVTNEPARAWRMEHVVAQRGARATLGLALAVADTLLADDALAPADRGRLLLNLSNLLPAAGETDRAVRALDEAVAIYTALAETDHDAHDPSLASSLNNLANRRSEAGDPEGALEAIRRAVAIWLRRQDRDADAPAHLADALLNLSAHLSENGEVVESIAVVREVIALYRGMIAAGETQMSANLAVALDNLAQLLFTGGDAQHDAPAALAASREAVAIRERLAADDPRLEADLVGSLRVLSNRLAAVGEPDAMAVARRAVDKSRQLVAQDARRYEALLAIAGETLAARHREAGELEAALTAIREAEVIFRTRRARRPTTGKPDLARTLAHLTTYLRLAGRMDEALASGSEAFGLWSELAAAHPLRFGPGVVQIGNELSIMRRVTGDVPGAVDAAEKAVAMARQLEVRAPGVYDYERAVVLGTLHVALLTVGDAAGALAAIEESAGILRSLAQRDPMRYERMLGEALMKQFQIIFVTEQLTEEQARRHPVFLEGSDILARLAAS